MAALCNRAGHYIFPCDFYLLLSFFFFFSSPNPSRRRLDVYHTSTHGVASVPYEFRMQVLNVLHAAHWKYRTQKIAKKWPSAHHRTTSSGYIFATEARIDNRKKLLKQQYLLHMFSQYGELRLRSVREFGAPQLISMGFASWQCYCTAL